MLLVILPICSGLLPFFLPTAIRSIAWGMASPPFVSYLALVSYREVSSAWQCAVYPPLQWARAKLRRQTVSRSSDLLDRDRRSGDWCPMDLEPLLANFDRLVGRPTREEHKASVPRVLAVPATVT